MKSMFRPTDLTVGRPLPVLALYAVPMLLSMFFQQAYNLADSWIAGTRIGSAALGAVGTCYPITVFFIAIASGLSMGTSIYCSQQFGAKEYRQVQSAVTTALFSFIPFSILLCLAALPASPAILNWLAVPAEAWEPTLRYLRIYLAGLPFLFLYNITTGILNGLGDSRTPLLFLVFSSLCNIVLDLALVIIIPLGISGLALATLLSQAAASLATLFTVRQLYGRLEMKQEDGSAPTAADRVPTAAAQVSTAAAQVSTAAARVPAPSAGKFSVPVLAEILRLGIPSVIQHVFMSTGQLFMQNVINSYGLIVMAGYSVAFRINGLVINSLMALSNALSGYIAQNKGAGEYGRIRSGYRVSLIISYLFLLIIVPLLLLRGPEILGLFIGSDPQREAIIEAGMGFVRIVSPFYLMVCLKNISDGALRGIGAMTLFMTATIVDVVIRILFGGLFSRLWGIDGVWWIWPFAWLIGTAVSFFGYHRKAKKLRH